MLVRLKNSLIFGVIVRTTQVLLMISGPKIYALPSFGNLIGFGSLPKLGDLPASKADANCLKSKGTTVFCVK